MSEADTIRETLEQLRAKYGGDDHALNWIQDISTETTALERRADEMRLHMLHELLATLDRDFAQAISPADAWSEALIRVGALERRAEQAEAALRELWGYVNLGDVPQGTIERCRPYLAATTPGEPTHRSVIGQHRPGDGQ